ncbi:phosphatidylserine decarboxylase [Microscilla marina]|uniref:Phosphatidylserine decarboxylase proenzyme n=1 Tax=Microscilla marina ATCC 23134 TaxID=313606 RepID=A1ZHI0_MICM2|nr:phosphatidylserine decarboxylase [Microscilla marina]EAY29987.1 phosphatidylserine decarboxylase [Microscilla marina ATCC 23134]
MQEIKYIDRKTQQIIYENPPGEGLLKFLYYNPFGQLPLHLVVKRKLLSTLYGKLMSSPRSKKNIQPFVDTYNIDMSEALLPTSEFNSFNEFFYRKLKPEVRPIEEGVVSPADGKMLVFENISELRSFFVKGNQFTLEKFLKDQALAAKYQNASLILVRLAPTDYHRFHFPLSGVAYASYNISGRYYSVSPYAVTPDFARVFCENKRTYTILSSPTRGDVLISPVGATMVGTIINTYEPNTQVNKGDEMGYFAFGGSSLLMLIDRDQVQLDEDLLANTRQGMETSVLMGERIGV